jgi:signal transduction histidine kinase
VTTAGQNEQSPNFQALEASEQPIFLWRPRDASIPWANRAGCALWSAANARELEQRRFDRSMPSVSQLQHLALVLADGASDDQDLLFWLPEGSRLVPCRCRKVRTGDGDSALLIEAGGQGPLIARHQGRPAMPGKPHLNGAAWPMREPGDALRLDPSSATTPPALQPQEAATLSEIARMIRQQVSSGGGPRVAERPQNQADPPAGSPFPELSAGSPELLGRLSHELRTPLNAIIGYAELLQAEQSGPLGSPKYRAYAGDILEAARHCLGLVNDLFGMTRYAAGELLLEFSEVDLNDSARICVGIIAPIAAKAGVTLTHDFAPALPLAIVDRRKLHQIVLNLLANAVKFTKAAGSVSISSRYEIGVGVTIAVADTGPGMTTGNLEAARGAVSLTASDIAGLGLPISRALAAANGATLNVDSQPGRGTRVTLFLPMSRLLLR